MPEASAAVAAAQLLAFCKDPVRHRPRLTHGRQIPPVGLHAFRFAQGKFPNGLLRELPPQERERLRKAANLFIRQICFWDGATHYQVLCVPPNARRETVKEHYHGLIALIHPDRQDGDSEHWPPEAAQRVNLAYAVLSDDAKRAEYDAGLHKSAADRGPREEEEPPSPETAAVRVPVRGRFTATRMKLRKPALYVGLAIASLFYLQVWFAGQISDNYSTLQTSTPLELSFQWVRNVFSGTDRPRYLGGDGLTANLQAASNNVRALEEPMPSVVFPRAAPPPAPLEARPAIKPPQTGDAAGQAIRGDSPTAGPQGRIQGPAVDVAPPRRDDGTGSSERDSRSALLASMQPSARQSAIDTPAMEILVSRLVTYYETGDLVRFLALFDADSLGFWEARSVRRDFEDFFSATKTRQLHVDRIAWEFAAGSARATGQAALVIEYKEGSERIERTVPVELDVVNRGGQGKIARISLFPREKAGR